MESGGGDVLQYTCGGQSITCVRLCVHACLCALVRVWRSEDSLRRFAPSTMYALGIELGSGLVTSTFIAEPCHRSAVSQTPQMAFIIELKAFKTIRCVA